VKIADAIIKNKSIKLLKTKKMEKMNPQTKTKTLVTNWAINNTIDYNAYNYSAQTKQF